MFRGSTQVYTLLAGIVLPLIPAVALAGPCSDDIASVGRRLSQSSALGPATTGTLSGAAPGAIKTKTTDEMASKAGTTASPDNRVGGTAGTKEVNAAVGQVATSPQDVRAQQEGKPTAAQIAARGSQNSAETSASGATGAQPDERMSQAKMELEKARMLDQKDDHTCADAVKRTRDLMGG